jgi:hypothetical protein
MWESLMASMTGIQGGVNGANFRNWGDFNEPKIKTLRDEGVEKQPDFEPLGARSNLTGEPLTQKIEVKIPNSGLTVTANRSLAELANLSSSPTQERFGGVGPQFNQAARITEAKVEIEQKLPAINGTQKTIVTVNTNGTVGLSSETTGKIGANTIKLTVGNDGAGLGFATNPKDRVFYEVNGSWDKSVGNLETVVGLNVNNSNAKVSFNTDGTVKIGGEVKLDKNNSLKGDYNFLTGATSVEFNANNPFGLGKDTSISIKYTGTPGTPGTPGTRTTPTVFDVPNDNRIGIYGMARF